VIHKRLVYIGLKRRNTVSTLSALLLRQSGRLVSFYARQKFDEINELNVVSDESRLLLAIFTKPGFFMRKLFNFKGAHEIASLSCYFLILQKAEEIKNTKVNY
jgi:hypothetical protein